MSLTRWFWTLFFTFLATILWTLGIIGSMGYAACTGHGGPINSLLGPMLAVAALTLLVIGNAVLVIDQMLSEKERETRRQDFRYQVLKRDCRIPQRVFTYGFPRRKTDWWDW